MAILLLMAAPFAACGSSSAGSGGSGGSGGGVAGNGGGDSGPAGAGGSVGGGGSDAGVAGSDSGASGSAGTDGGAEGGGNCSKYAGISADQACTDLADAFCGLIYQCSPVVSRFDSEATCKTRQHLACVTGLSLPGNGVPPGDVEWEASAIQAVTCNDFYKFYAGAVPAGSPPCAIAGTLADGKGCADDSQCASGFCSLTSGVCGTCAGKAADGATCSYDDGCKSAHCDVGSGTCTEPGQVGASCQFSMDCAAGLYCAVPGVCAQTNQAGQACSSYDDEACVTGLVCGTANQCEIPPLGAAGAACSTYVTFSCDAFHSLSCDPVTSKCVDNPPAAVGQSCGSSSNPYAPCVAGASCVQGVCVKDAKDGDPCDDVNGPFCVLPAQCVNGTCTIVDASVCPAN